MNLEKLLNSFDRVSKASTCLNRLRRIETFLKKLSLGPGSEFANSDEFSKSS